MLVLESLFKKVAGLRSRNAGKIFKNTYFYEQLYLRVAWFTVHEKETANEAWLEPSQTWMM